MVRGKRDSVVERADIDAVLSALFDIRNELIEIRTILKEDDGEEREDP